MMHKEIICLYIDNVLIGYFLQVYLEVFIDC